MHITIYALASTNAISATERSLASAGAVCCIRRQLQRPSKACHDVVAGHALFACVALKAELCCRVFMTIDNVCTTCSPDVLD